MVGVLVLVHQHRAEAGLQPRPHLRPGRQQPHAFQEQVPEVQAAGGAQALLVQAVGLREVDLGAQIPEAQDRQVILRGQAAVLGPGDAGGELPQPVPAHPPLHGHAQQRQGVLVVVDREVARQARRLCVAAQQPGAEGVEGLDHHLRARRRKPAHPLAHLLGRLVGEGHRQDRLRRVAAGLQEMSDLGGDDPRLSRAGPGQDEQWAALVQDRFPLRLVQPGEIGGTRPVRGGRGLRRRQARPPGPRRCAARCAPGSAVRPPGRRPSPRPGRPLRGPAGTPDPGPGPRRAPAPR